MDRGRSIINHQSNRPAAAIAVCFALGITFSQICPHYSFFGLASANGLLIYASFLALRGDRLTISLLLGLSAILTSGLLMALAHQDSYPSFDLRALLSSRAFPVNDPVHFTGCVIRDSEIRDREIITTISLRAFQQKDQWTACGGKGILRIAQPNPNAGPWIDLKRGDRLDGWATWRIPRNFENPGSADRSGLLARRGIFLTGRIKSTRLMEVIPGDCSNLWTELATSVAGRVRKSLEPIRSRNNGQAAAILASLVIGDYSGLDNTTREIFQNTGTFHVLVVSGLHVAWIAGVLLQLFKWIRLPERIRYLMVALVILFYTCVVGFQASITRCLWMFILYLIGRIIFRHADPVNILFISALTLLGAQPDWLFELGFQLSFLSILALALTAAPVIRNYWKPIWDPLLYCGRSQRLFLQKGSWHRRGRNLLIRCQILIEEIVDRPCPVNPHFLFFICRCFAGAALAIGSIILTTLSVQLWIEPILACNFNRISWVAPLATLLVVPFSSFVLSVGMIASLAIDLPFIGPALPQIAGALSSLFLSVTASFAAIPGAWQRCPTPSLLFVWGFSVILFVWSFFEWRRYWIPCTFILVLIACLAYGSVPVLETLFIEWRSAGPSRKEEIWKGKGAVLGFTFLDVGEGDSIVIRFPDRRVWLLDAGGLRNVSLLAESSYGLDTGEAIVSRYLWHNWITSLDRLILSHTDTDHAGGVPAVMKNFSISRFNYSAAYTDSVLDKIMDIARKRNLETEPLHMGMKEDIGPVKVRVLNPPVNSRLSSANESSIVIEFIFNGFSALLTGDLEKTGELRLLSQPGNLHIQLLKVAHHGSQTSTSAAFLDRAKPRWGIISAGQYNPYGHPSSQVLARLRQNGVRIISTIDEGAITVETDGQRYRIRSHLSGILEQGDL